MVSARGERAVEVSGANSSWLNSCVRVVHMTASGGQLAVQKLKHVGQVMAVIGSRKAVAAGSGRAARNGECTAQTNARIGS